MVVTLLRLLLCLLVGYLYVTGVDFWVLLVLWFRC